MRRKSYPVCARCDAEINPNKYDDCDKYYEVGGEVYCKDCFKDWLMDWIETDMDDVAAAAKVPVIPVF